MTFGIAPTFPATSYGYIAKGAAPYFLSDRERQEIYSGALRSLRRLLPGEPEGTGRIVLLALHILLAREGAEDDVRVLDRRQR